MPRRGFDVAEGAVDGRLVAHVAGDPEKPIVGRRLEVEAGDARSVLVQHFGDAVADAPRRAGDYGHSVLEPIDVQQGSSPVSSVPVHQSQ